MESFCRREACDQAVLPDWSVLKGQKLVENAKFKKIKCDTLSNFQTMCKTLTFQYFDGYTSVVNVSQYFFGHNPAKYNTNQYLLTY